MASGNENINAKESVEIKERREIIHENGYTVEVTTRYATLEQYLAEQSLKGQPVYKSNITTTPDQQFSLSYLQEDHLYGSGSAYNSSADATGTCWTNDILIGLNVSGGIIKGDIYAYSGNSSVYSKPKLTLTTWGLVGGSMGVIRDYVFTNSSYGTGTVTYGIDTNLSGAIAYYSVSLYGMHKLGTTQWQSNATLYEK